LARAAYLRAMPEPASVALLASGLVGLLAMKRRAKRGADAAGSAL
jgi:hypothetical protein